MVEIEQSTQIRDILKTLREHPIEIAKQLGDIDEELVDRVVESIREDTNVSPLQIQA